MKAAGRCLRRFVLRLHKACGNDDGNRNKNLLIFAGKWYSIFQEKTDVREAETKIAARTGQQDMRRMEKWIKN